MLSSNQLACFVFKAGLLAAWVASGIAALAGGRYYNLAELRIDGAEVVPQVESAQHVVFSGTVSGIPSLESADSGSVLEYEPIAQPVGAAAGAAAAKAVDSVVESADLGSVPEYKQIAQLAYFYWQARGCPEGSLEEDWFGAEAALRKPAAGAAA